MAGSAKPENGDLNIGLHATIKSDELNYSNFPSDIHSAAQINSETDMQPLFHGDDKHPSVLMVQTGRLIRPRQDMSPSTVSPKLQLPALKCRLYHRPPLQCPHIIVDSRPIWVIFCHTAKVHCMGQQLLFHAGPSGESVPFD